MNSIDLITDFVTFSDFDDYMSDGINFDSAEDLAKRQAKLEADYQAYVAKQIGRNGGVKAGEDPLKGRSEAYKGWLKGKYEDMKKKDHEAYLKNRRYDLDRALYNRYLKEAPQLKTRWGHDVSFEAWKDLRKVDRLNKANKAKAEAALLSADIANKSLAESNKSLAESEAAFEAYKNRGLKQRLSDTWSSGAGGKAALIGAGVGTAAVGTLAGLGIAGARGVGPMASDSAKAKRVDRLMAEGKTAKAMQIANSIKDERIRGALLSQYAAPALPPPVAY